MSLRWVYNAPECEDTVRQLQEKLGVSNEIAHLLSLRGIRTFEQAKTFFRPDLSHLHDPFLMKDMEKASDRLSAAIRNHEKVLVYGDYDVDGITATSTMLLFLNKFGLETSFYIPHRFKEGYGISPDGVQYAKDSGASLIVSVDCGITAVEEAKVARSLGIDLVVCDHHTVGNELPDAVALLDPKRPDCGYPFDGLSGAGVAFKLIQATTLKLGLGEEVACRYLDLVAISIASDIVPIVDENRAMMRTGLEMMNLNPRPGIRALLDILKGRGGSISTSTITFSLGPRINAAGRMGDAAVAVDLMISADEKYASDSAMVIESINATRRKTDMKTMEEAVAMLDSEHDVDELSSMVLHDPDWHLGVIGIVASRLVDRYYRPVIMLGSVDGKVKGSARSVQGFNIYDALKECEDLLIQFGGHEFAAGLTMEKENLKEFRRRLNEIATTQLSKADFRPELKFDARIGLDEIDLKFWKILSQFEPFGPGNLKPIFVSEGIELSGEPAIVGNGHLKLRLRQNGSGVFDAIGFNMHEYVPMLRENGQSRIDVAYVIEENYWNNKRSLQLQLKDIRLQAN